MLEESAIFIGQSRSMSYLRVNNMKVEKYFGRHNVQNSEELNEHRVLALASNIE